MEERLWKHSASPLLFMFEKLSRKFGSKAAGSAVEGVKETLNDKLEDYSGIIKIGLVLAVIVFGGKHLIEPKGYNAYPTYAPPRIPSGGQPIIINNFYRETKGDIANGKSRKNNQVR